MKNKFMIIALCITAFVVGLLIYINPILLYRNYKLKNYIESISLKETIKTKELVPFDFDELYIIYPYTSKNDIQKLIGFNSRYIKENNNDTYQTVIVTKNNKIIAYANISFDYSFQSIAAENRISSKNDTIIKVYKHEDGCSFIEQYRSIKHSYYDINFVLLGSYWEEDDEEVGKFYYLDIDSDEYLLVTKEDKFNYKKYVKDKNITKSEDLLINDFKTKYIEVSNDNNIDLIYIFYVNDSAYIFRLNSLKENVDENKKDLYNIIQSVKE